MEKRNDMNEPKYKSKFWGDKHFSYFDGVGVGFDVPLKLGLFVGLNVGLFVGAARQ
jgi:hypothetical protein